MKRWRPWLVSLGVTGTIFWYLFSQIDASELISTARGMTPRYLTAFLVLLVTGTVVRAVRFRIILGAPPSLRVLTAIVMARNLFVDLLPARLGELSYVYFLSHRGNRPTEEGVASLFLSLLFDLIALTPLLFLSVLIVGNSGTISTPIMIGFTVGTLTVTLTLLKTANPLGRWLSRLLNPSHRVSWRARTAGLISRTLDVLLEVERRKIFTKLLVVSTAVRLCKFGSYYFLVLAIMEPLGYAIDEIGFFRVFLGVVSAELAAALPIYGIGGFGTFELAWSFSFSQLGFSSEHAVISGILAHAVSQAVEYTLGIGALLYVMRPRAQVPPRTS